ncbi:cell surface protein [Halalkaliarchaeum desulfuricum]|uniref:Cell surface protein n=2 Tax=Halalkaliarchaeum desulfuricum TaxID=2055893 RepID=A0A343TN79_9EURY|nr:cell surface protein [Halalkaliarchaeum desulfuricum]
MLKTIGASVVASGALAGGAVGSDHCDHTVEDGESIQAAINEAEDGDVICIESGTYEESLNITQADGLTLEGAGPGEVVVDASGEKGYGVDGVFSSDEWGSDVTLRGFTLKGPRQGTASQNFGLKLSYIDGLTVENVHVTESRRTGIDVNPAENVSLRDVKSTDNDANGIAIRDAADVTVDNATTEGNAWGGFAFYALGEESVDNVVISNSTFQNEPAGIYLQHTDHTNIRIRESSLVDNTVGLAVAESVDGGEVTANNNNIEGNADYGVVNQSDGILDARRCWWGDRRGPNNPADERGGDGDTVSENVRFRPHRNRPV